MTEIDATSAPDDESDQPDHDGDGDGDDSRLARMVASDESMVWLKRITMGLALAFLVGALGYFIGVRTSAPPGNDVDLGFIRDMTAHHDQAVRMAQSEIANGSDPVTKGFAMEVILFQRQEIGQLQTYNEERGAVSPAYSLDRTTMEWMGMPTPLKAMPGMATEDQLKQLDAARGTDADKLFLTLMQAHHLGGVHMAEYEAQNGAAPHIKDLADGMARNQRIEVREYQIALDRLNGKK